MIKGKYIIHAEMKYSDSNNIAVKIIHKETAREHRLITRDNIPYILYKPGIQTLLRLNL